MVRKKKQEEEVEDVIIRGDINDIISSSMGEYSKYVIQSRALPDVRDGLLPVRRRVLYGMSKLKNTYNRPYSKSAKSVGFVMGGYHPHGDSGIYGSMVTMSRDWNQRLPYIDWQGNNGSIDGETSPA